MPTRTFISFKGEDELKVWTLRHLSEFKNVEFEFDDVSLRKEIDSRDKSYIKSVIRPKIKKCEVCLCMIGENTYRSQIWVPWEIETAIEEQKPVFAMRFKGMDHATTPAVLNENGIRPFNWDLDKLFQRIGM